MRVYVEFDYPPIFRVDWSIVLSLLWVGGLEVELAMGCLLRTVSSWTVVWSTELVMTYVTGFCVKGIFYVKRMLGIKHVLGCNWSHHSEPKHSPNRFVRHLFDEWFQNTCSMYRSLISVYRTMRNRSFTLLQEKGTCICEHKSPQRDRWGRQVSCRFDRRGCARGYKCTSMPTSRLRLCCPVLSCPGHLFVYNIAFLYRV